MTIFKIGDIVVYNPPYPVDGRWLEYQRNKQEFIVVRGTGVEVRSTIEVTDMKYAGLERNEIPYPYVYKLNANAFYHAVPQNPTWEL